MSFSPFIAPRTPAYHSSASSPPLMQQLPSIAEQIAEIVANPQPFIDAVSTWKFGHHTHRSHKTSLCISVVERRVCRYSTKCDYAHSHAEQYAHAIYSDAHLSSLSKPARFKQIPCTGHHHHPLHQDRCRYLHPGELGCVYQEEEDEVLKISKVFIYRKESPKASHRLPIRTESAPLPSPQHEKPPVHSAPPSPAHSTQDIRTSFAHPSLSLGLRLRSLTDARTSSLTPDPRSSAPSPQLEPASPFDADRPISGRSTPSPTMQDVRFATPRGLRISHRSPSAGPGYATPSPRAGLGQTPTSSDMPDAALSRLVSASSVPIHSSLNPFASPFSPSYEDEGSVAGSDSALAPSPYSSLAPRSLSPSLRFVDRYLSSPEYPPLDRRIAPITPIYDAKKPHEVAIVDSVLAFLHDERDEASFC